MRFGRYVSTVEGGRKGQKYIDLAQFLLDCRYTASANDRERQEYDQSHLPVVQQYEAVGHAVRAAYSYSGMADIAVETGDPEYRSAVKSLWDNMVNKKYYVTGGIGSGETSEGFGPNYSLRNRSYCESCSTCGAIFLHWKMNLAYHDARYVDLYEEAMYNALLGSTDLAGKNFYYTNPLDENATRAPWHNCPCCVGNIPRTLLMMPTWMYATGADGVYVNLFAGSTVTIPGIAGTDVELVQQTDYPWNGRVAITVNPKTAATFAVRIRVPNRNTSVLYRAEPDAGGIESLSVNGTAMKPAIQKGYAVIRRAWKAGDKIEFVAPMKAQRVRAGNQIDADHDRVALRYGPLIYNIEKVDQDIAKTLAPGSPLEAQWKGDLLGGIMAITGKFADGSPMLAIPHYTRMNRELTVAADPSVNGGRPAPRPPASIVWIKES